MKSPKGKEVLAGGAGRPVSRHVPRISNGLRRTVLTNKKTASGVPVALPSRAGSRLQDRLHTRLNDLLAAEFAAYAQRGLTRKRLAARLGRSPEEIGKWLSAPGALATDAVHGVLAVTPEAKPARRVSRPRKAAAGPAGAETMGRAPGMGPVEPPADAERMTSLTIGTTIAISATMVGPGFAALAMVDVNPVAQVEVV